MIRLEVEGHLDRELLQGTIDMHLHLMPCPFPRPFRDEEAAALALEAGMRGFVIKDHHSPTPLCASALRDRYPSLDAIGSVVLNRTIGGINPHAVEAQAEYGAKVVWMPTIHAENHLNVMGVPSFHGYPAGTDLEVEPIRILDETGRLVPELKSVVDVVVDRDLCLATGHVGPEEQMALVEHAVGAGCERVLVTHANFEDIMHLDTDDMRELVRRGARLEFCLWFSKWTQESPSEMASRIKTLGAENIVLATDSGNLWSPSPPEHLRVLISVLLNEGISPEEIRTMTVANPCDLLGLP